MYAPFVKLVVLANTLLLALPAGICCSAPAGRGASAEEIAPAGRKLSPQVRCCTDQQKPGQQSAGQQITHPPQQRPASTRDAINCCCRQAPTATGQRDLPLVAHALFTVPSVIVPHPAHASGIRQPRTYLEYPGPSLQSLQCIWRC